MTQRERELIPRLLAKFLQDHQGNANAIKCETLAKHFGVPYNTIRRCVFMLTERGHLIASATSGKARGYFIAKTLEERRMYKANLKARATENFEHLRVFSLAENITLNVPVEQFRLEM